MKKFCLQIYQRLFLIFQGSCPNKEVPERFIHAHLVVALSTGLLMWSYAFLAYFTISSPVPGIVGFIASMVHLLSPLLYRRSSNCLFNASVLLGAGLVHQSTFSFYTGGFDSNILIWLGILPLLGGVMVEKKGVLIWAIISAIVICVFFIIKMSGFNFPFLISEKGMIVAQGLILFGWVFVASFVIWVYISLVQKSYNELDVSRNRTQNLINMLSHDISTPLMVISGRLNSLLRTDLSDEQRSGITKAFKASEQISKITQSVRDLRLNDLGKKQLTIAEVDVRDLILELKDHFIDKLEQKQIHFHWSVASEVCGFYSNRSLLLNQILGNLLFNAIKFSSPNQEIRLRVSKVNNNIQFLLEDSGVGIPVEMRNDIFEANLSRSSLGTMGESGTGFGLPIVKGCVERLRGNIFFKTKTAEEGPSGTTFVLTFPQVSI